MIGPKLTISITNNDTVLATWLYPKEGKYETVEQRTTHITYTKANKKERERFIQLIRHWYFDEAHPDAKDGD